LQKHEVGTTL